MKNGDLPAFPASGSWNDNQPDIISVQQEGLTKREEFARSAMQGMLSNRSYLADSQIKTTICKLSIAYADEILAELEMDKVKPIPEPEPLNMDKWYINHLEDQIKQAVEALKYGNYTEALEALGYDKDGNKIPLTDDLPF